MTSEATTATPLEVLNAALEAKVCTKCGESKALGEFNRSHKTCRACDKEVLRVIRQNKHDRAVAAEAALTERACKKCNKTRPIDEFRVHSNGIHRGVCISCENKAANTRLGPKRKTARDAREIALGLTERTCTKCRQTRPLEDFPFRKQGYPGRFSWCCKCKYAVDAASVKKHREEFGRRPSSVGSATTRWLGKVRSRAVLAGIPFDLTLADVFIPEFCPVLGIRLERQLGRNRGFTDNCPSLDRLIPSKGYVKGNVVVVSGRANKLKSNCTADELERIAAWMRSQGLP